jgi:uncharacterized protein YecE (DUF72 family)
VIRIGTSGWTYADWRKRFYPPGVPQRRWLAYYAERFDTVELNATTYRLPKPERIDVWCRTVPPEFRYTVKLSRLITHRRTLTANLDRFVSNYFERAACFEPQKLAQILVQFPPFLERDDAWLETFLSKLPPGYRYVVEFRNATWFAGDVREILAARNVAFCIHDYPELAVPLWVTRPDLAYVRFHGYNALYAGSYPPAHLRGWAERLSQLAAQAGDVYAYFNNDTAAAAPYDAAALKSLLND